MTRLEKLLKRNDLSQFSSNMAWIIGELLIRRDAQEILAFAQELETNGFAELGAGCRKFLERAKVLHRDKLSWNETQMKNWVQMIMRAKTSVVNETAFEMLARLDGNTIQKDMSQLFDDRVKGADLFGKFYTIRVDRFLDHLCVRYNFPPGATAYFVETTSTEPVFSKVKHYEELPLGVRQLANYELLEVHELKNEKYTFAICFSARGHSIYEITQQHPTGVSWFAPLFNDE
jgi:hypothetical protein